MSETNDSSENLEKVDCHLRNLYSMTPFTLKWTIENLTKFPGTKTMETCDFYPFPECTWKLKCSVSSQVTFYQVFLMNKTKSEANVEYSWKVQNSELVISKSTGYAYPRKDGSSLFLFSFPTNIEGFAEGLPVTITLCMEIYEVRMARELCSMRGRLSVRKELLPENSSKHLLNKLRSMRLNSQHTDIDLCIGDRVIKAHKLILVAGSPVFSRMFEHEMAEQQCNKIEIPDIPYAVCEQLVDFLYCGLSDVQDFESAFPLYYAADKYEVVDLRKFCGQVLLTRMTCENALEVLAMARRHNDQDLANAAIEFINFNLSSILGTPKWHEFVSKEVDAAAEVLNFGLGKLQKIHRSFIHDKSI